MVPEKSTTLSRVQDGHDDNDLCIFKHYERGGEPFASPSIL